MSDATTYTPELAAEFMLGAVAMAAWSHSADLGKVCAELSAYLDEIAPSASLGAEADEGDALAAFRAKFCRAAEGKNARELEELCGALADRIDTEPPAAGNRLRALLESVGVEELQPEAPAPVVAAVDALHAALGAAYGGRYDVAIVVADPSGDRVLVARDRHALMEIRPREARRARRENDG